MAGNCCWDIRRGGGSCGNETDLLRFPAFAYNQRIKLSRKGIRMTGLQYQRVLIKLSGEALSTNGKLGIDPPSALEIATKIKQLYETGAQIAIVIGGGNLWRGRIGIEVGMDQPTADYMGMLATVMNSLVLMDSLEKIGVMTRVQTAISRPTIAEPYIRRRAIRHIEKGRVVIFGGGTGNPLCTTDTAAAQRAIEINADLLIKATKVDGVYDSDPKRNPDAKRYERISYMDVLSKRLGVMDSTAISMCMDYKMPMMILNFWDDGALIRAVHGETVGTIVVP